MACLRCQELAQYLRAQAEAARRRGPLTLANSLEERADAYERDCRHAAA